MTLNCAPRVARACSTVASFASTRSAFACPSIRISALTGTGIFSANISTRRQTSRASDPGLQNFTAETWNLRPGTRLDVGISLVFLYPGRLRKSGAPRLQGSSFFVTSFATERPAAASCRAPRARGCGSATHIRCHPYAGWTEWKSMRRLPCESEHGSDRTA